MITWRRNGRPLLSDRFEIDIDMENGSSSVAIDTAQLDDIGTWTCVATNSVGSDTFRNVLEYPNLIGRSDWPKRAVILKTL